MSQDAELMVTFKVSKRFIIIPVSINTGFYFILQNVSSLNLVNFCLGLKFRDKTEDGHPDKIEERRAITLSKFTDRVYYNAPNTCTLSGMHGENRMFFILTLLNTLIK